MTVFVIRINSTLILAVALLEITASTWLGPAGRTSWQVSKVDLGMGDKTEKPERGARRA